MSEQPIYHCDGDVFVPTSDAAGPWFPGVQHGGAVAGLITRAVETHPSAQPMQVVRMTIELFRKVPMGPTSVTVRPARDGRRIQALDVEVNVEGVVVSRATVLRIRVADGVIESRLVPDAPTADGPMPEPESLVAAVLPDGPFDFIRCFDVRRPVEPAGGLGSTWYRLLSPLVDDEEPSPLVRVAVAADLSMSAGHLVGHRRYTSANPDLTIYLERPPTGPWIGLDGIVRITTGGVGVTDSVLHDRAGRIGRVLKSLLIDRR